MGNIGPIRKETKPTNVQDQIQKEVKGSASSQETKASSQAASNVTIEGDAAAYRKHFIEKFGKDYGNQIADALDKLRQEGKFVTYEAVMGIMQSVFAKDKEGYKKLEKEINEIANWFPYEASAQKPKDDFDPLKSEKIQEAMRKEIRKRETRMQENIEESDKQSDLEKKKELEKAMTKKRPIEPKDRV